MLTAHERRIMELQQVLLEALQRAGANREDGTSALSALLISIFLKLKKENYSNVADVMKHLGNKLVKLADEEQSEERRVHLVDSGIIH